MELVDILDNKNRLTGRQKDRHLLGKNEYRKSVHVWIINNKLELLMQQRSTNTKKFPGLWSQTAGGVLAGEDSLYACVRESKEELGIQIKIPEIEFIGSFKRNLDFVDIYLIQCELNLQNININLNEVINVKWMSIECLFDLIIMKQVIPSIRPSLDYLLNYIQYRNMQHHTFDIPICLLNEKRL